MPNDLHITVVMGGLAPYLESVKSKAITRPYTTEVKVDVGSMANSDIAIGAAGATTWERCCLGLPALLFITANNQKEITNNLEQLGVVKIVKNFTQDFQVLSNNFSAWKKMSNHA